MASRPRPTSRQPARRTRKVASRLPATPGEEGGAPETPVPVTPVAETPADEKPASQRPADAKPVAGAPTAYAPLESDPGEPPHHGVLDRMGTLVGLVVALVLLVGTSVWLGHYVWFTPEPTVSAERPVVTGEIQHRAAVEAASQDVADILSYGYQDFDKQVAAARSRMTPGFAARFAQTASDVRDRFLQGKLDQQVKVRAAGVVRATSTQVQALLFLDQFVTHGSQSKESTYTPYRALVTMVHTEHGWLVDNIDTK